ncbi:hypothetical protein [Hyphomonas sp.]|uniref:hypothetical protein n=1 Tax=Hyphomonas sp. TaxID=87 RepID=UPI0025BAA739|nr:hypothetical protein [Hyphomonas sp.]
MSNMHDMGYSASNNRLQQSGSKTFLALNSQNTKDDNLKEKFVKSRPNLILNGSDFLLDFSNTRSENEFSEIIETFQLKGATGTFTISNAEYNNSVYGLEFNFSGEYTYLKTVGKDKIVVTPPAGITYSQSQKIYKSEYFNSDFLFGVTLAQSSRTSYRLVNNLGFQSRESFANLGILSGDYIKISSATGGISENRLYKVKETSLGPDNEEILELNREIAELDLTGIPTVISLFKSRNAQQNFGTSCFYAKETTFDPENYVYYESGQLIECKSGYREWGEREASYRGYDFYFSTPIPNLSSDSFNATSCFTCPSLYTGRAINATAPEVELGDNLKRVSTELTKFTNKELKRKAREEFIGGTEQTQREVLLRENVNFKTIEEYQGYVDSVAKRGTSRQLQTAVTNTYKVTYDKGLFIDGVKNSTLTLEPGKTYRFDVSDTSMSSNSVGPYSVYGTDTRTGQKGYYYPLYVNSQSNTHTHSFVEYPGRIFYMPNQFLPATNHAQRTNGGYPLYEGSFGNPDKTIRIGFSSLSDGTNSGASEIVTGIQRVGKAGRRGSFITVTVPRNLERLYYFVSGIAGQGGYIEVSGRQAVQPQPTTPSPVTTTPSPVTPSPVTPPAPQTQMRMASTPSAPARSVSPPPSPPPASPPPPAAPPPSGGGGYGY